MGDFYTQLQDTQHGNEELSLLKTGCDQHGSPEHVTGGLPLFTICPLPLPHGEQTTAKLVTAVCFTES